jgi:transcriptional regulator with XRE-family HTH domain
MDKGLSQRELGNLINKSDSTICNYEKGVHAPDIETISKIADCFDVSIDYLLKRTKFKYSINYLNNHLSSDFTLGDLLNTTIKLDSHNRKLLVEYIRMLSVMNNITKSN